MPRGYPVSKVIFIDYAPYSFVAGCDEHPEYREAFSNPNSARESALEHREQVHDKKGAIRIQQ